MSRRLLHKMQPLYNKKLACARTAQANYRRKDKLAFLDGFGGALLSAGTAGNADIGIDNVLAVAFGNSLNRALLGAGAAGNASVSNDVSHGITSNILVCLTLMGNAPPL